MQQYNVDLFLNYFSNLILEEARNINRQEIELENAKQRLADMKRALESYTKNSSNTVDDKEILGVWRKVVYEPKVYGESGWIRYRCSKCTALNDVVSDFCPHCGQKMLKYTYENGIN